MQFTASASEAESVGADSQISAVSVPIFFDKENTKNLHLVNMANAAKKRKQTTPVPKPDQNKRRAPRSPSPAEPVPQPSSAIPGQTQILRQTVEELRQRCNQAEEECRKNKELSARSLEEAHSTLKRAARNMSQTLIEVAKREREATRKRMCEEVDRLGRYTVVGRMQGR